VHLLILLKAFLLVTLARGKERYLGIHRSELLMAQYKTARRDDVTHHTVVTRRGYFKA
jgi:hypothetical protein